MKLNSLNQMMHKISRTHLIERKGIECMSIQFGQNASLFYIFREAKTYVNSMHHALLFDTDRDRISN